MGRRRKFVRAQKTKWKLSLVNRPSNHLDDNCEHIIDISDDVTNSSDNDDSSNDVASNGSDKITHAASDNLHNEDVTPPRNVSDIPQVIESSAKNVYDS